MGTLGALQKPKEECAGCASGACSSCAGGGRQAVASIGLVEGAPLDGGTRSRMESAFGRDFSYVRVHAGAEGARASAGMNARAFAVGSDIGFGSGEYQPDTPVGDALIAHELAHVVHAGGQPDVAGPGAHPRVSDDPGMEAEAHGAAAAVALGESRVAATPRRGSGGGLAIHRCVQTGGGITPSAFNFEQLTGAGDPNERSFPWYAACVNMSIAHLGVATRVDMCQFEVGFPGIHRRGRTSTAEAASTAAEAFNTVVPQLLRSRSLSCALVATRVQAMMQRTIPGVRVNTPCITRALTPTQWPTRH